MSSNVLGPEWNLSPDGINIVTENGTIKDSKTALKKALDCDLKAIGKSALPSELSKHQVGKIVLQIQKIRNISAPKAKEESQAAPRMLKLTLTDGESYVQAIEVTSISSISRDKTAPGTKVLVNGAIVNSGYLLISPQNFSVLGGQVEHLYEKWVLAKSIQQNHQYVSNEGAPPWVAFGGKIITGNQDKPYKSLDKSKDENADSEFEQQRKEAIAEVSTGAVKKTFGGRVRQNVQPSQTPSNQYNNRGRQNDRGDHDRGGRRGKFASRDDDGIENHQKPSEKVSLFSFLEDKLPISDTKKPAAPSPSCNKNNCNDYHQRDPRIQQKASSSYNSRQQYDKNASNNYAGKDKSSYNATTTTTTHTSASKPLSKPEPKSSLAAKNLPQKSGGTVTSDNPKTSASETRTSSNHSRNTANSGGESNGSRNSQQKNPKDQNWNGNKDGYYQQPYQNQHKSNNDRYAQQQSQGAANQYRNNSDRYPQKSTNNSNSTTPTPYPAGDNFSHQQQNNYRSNNDRYSQQQQQPQNVPPYPRDNFGHQQNHGAPPPYSNNPKQQYPNANSYPQQSNTQYNQKPPQNAQPGPEPAELHQLANNLSKMSVSNEFASRSLRQHLNLGPPKKQEVHQDSSAAPGLLNVGEQCMAKYWEDGKFYPAIIAAITEKTYAVQFKGYGNIEEVLKHDCFSAANAYNQPNRNPNFNNYQQNNFSGTSMEFRSRRGPPRN